MGHAHQSAPKGNGDNQRRILWALLLTGGFFLVELMGGILSGSLALIADAGHMATDCASMLLAWLAFRLARRPADNARSYGFHRAEILAAFINGLAMLALVAWIVYEAISRLRQPVEVLGGMMLGVALAGLVVNIVAFFLLHGGDRHNLNLRGALVHVIGDLLGSLAAIVGAVVILLTGWTAIDPLLSLLVAMLLLRSAWYISRESAHILMEGTPPRMDLEQMRIDLRDHTEGVDNIHHLHAWSLTQERPLVTMHAQISESADSDSVLRRLNKRLRSVYAVSHATIQIERGQCPPEGSADNLNAGNQKEEGDPSPDKSPDSDHHAHSQ